MLHGRDARWAQAWEHRGALTVWAVIDTSVYIGHWERGLYADRLNDVRNAFVVRHSAVVLSELRRGARTPQAARTVARL